MFKGKELIGEINATVVPYGCLAVWFLGQASVIIKGADVTVYIDPYVSPDPDRSFPPPVTPEEITNMEVCLITHDHSDHLDEAGLPIMAAGNPAAQFMAPAVCLERLQELGIRKQQLMAALPAEETELVPGLQVIPVAAAHEELELDEAGQPRYVGYILQLNGVTLYHSGDTVLFPELIEETRSRNIDLALLPINGRDYYRNSRGIVGNMNYREAAEFAATSGFETVIPLHYDLFAGNAENPGYFVDYLYRNFPEQKFHMMARAERFVYVSAQAFKR
ncbi:MBL fold metallo-hydrolase [Paenibacillus sp. MMS20-IR301]|uniref:MBL fold metallo-hydrolase n=1 Tax=Paenibacillus sp. MMS20-IR301 TaxID=2895946 RepID=UPI0028E85735|nr:MBL fold metallo-hydrolase [Paenibacillus sp. MMS20-IR301]WNS44240.1 MBL fold metallo-hydrolase [Paenibacillus sp. MMS20-IR301]